MAKLFNWRHYNIRQSFWFPRLEPSGRDGPAANRPAASKLNYAVGGTVEEKGFDTAPTAGGVYEVLRAASELVPGIDELQIDELSVGLRPGTPDNAPAIGPGALAGLTWATGHYRNGILLAPLTGELVAATLTGKTGELEQLLAACAPERFAAEHMRAGA